MAFDHLIPRTYLRPWCYKNESIYTYDKSLLIKSRNINSIFGREKYHSIRAGFVFQTADSLEYIFHELSQYNITLDDVSINSYEMMNSNYYKFDDWSILYLNGSNILRRERNSLKTTISQKSYDFIEREWNAKYETKWNSFITLIRMKVASNEKSDRITIEEAASIFEYYIMFDWRKPSGNKEVNEPIELIFEFIDFYNCEIPYYDRIDKRDATFVDEMQHAYYLKSFNDFLNNTPNSLMRKQIDKYFAQLSFLFCMPENDGDLFVTSDKPCFTFQNEEGAEVPILVALPNLMISLCRKSVDSASSYKILLLTSEKVKYYNNTILHNSELTILPNENLLNLF